MSDAADDAEGAAARRLEALALVCGQLSTRERCLLAATCAGLRRHAAASAHCWSTVVLSGPRDAVRFLERAVSQPRFARIDAMDVSFCDPLTDSHLRALPTGVSDLKLDACHYIGDDGVRAVAERCAARLEGLSIYWNNRVTDRALLALSLRCLNLRTLRLAGCSRLGSTGVLALASRCRRLELLDLTRVTNVDDAAVGAIAEASPSLRELRLYACPQITDAPFRALAAGCRGLTSLDCTGLREMTDSALSALGACSQLRKLLLSWAVQVTDVGVCALVAAGAPLEILSLHGVKGVSDVAIDALADHCAGTLVALDVRGCIHVAGRAPDALRARLPRLRTFVLHT